MDLKNLEFTAKYGEGFVFLWCCMNVWPFALNYKYYDNFFNYFDTHFAASVRKLGIKENVVPTQDKGSKVQEMSKLGCLKT